MTDYLTMADALAIHGVMIRRYGGSGGVRDMGALESALYRPQSGYYEDIIQETAALMESLSINHPFVDGNKRIAFSVCDVFLRINGYAITATPEEIYKKMINMFESGTFKYETIEPWLRKIVKENL